MGLVIPVPLYGEWFPRTKAEQQEVIAQMELVLASPPFRQSKRSKTLLQFLVEKTLKGHESVLKERTLGIEVFGRAPDYDTNADPIVRMAAGEIRKRLAQYYHDLDRQNELHIDLAPGSYVMQFRFHQERVQSRDNRPDASHSLAPQDDRNEPEPPTDTTLTCPKTEDASRTTRRVGLRFFFAVCTLILILAGVLWVLLIPKDRSFLALAWGNVLDGNSPTLITVGEPKLYPAANTTDGQKPMTASEHLRNGDSLTYSEVQALVRLVTFLDRRKSFILQAAGATNFADLRRGPAVLLGGLNNPWTLRAQQVLPFRLATDGSGVDWIADARNPNDRRWAVDFNRPYSDVTKDYAVVARFVDPSSQEPTLIVAGLGENGTKAAAEFITGDGPLRKQVGDWLRESANKNFEVVLETQVINGVSGPPKLLDKSVW